jgi:hypothetical protein
MRSLSLIAQTSSQTTDAPRHLLRTSLVSQLVSLEADKIESEAISRHGSRADDRGRTESASSEHSRPLFIADLRATYGRSRPLQTGRRRPSGPPEQAWLMASCSRPGSGTPPLRRPTPRPTSCRALRLRRSCRASSTTCRAGSEDSPRASPPRPPAGPAA